MQIKHQAELPISTIDCEAADAPVLSNAVMGANARGAWRLGETHAMRRRILLIAKWVMILWWHNMVFLMVLLPEQVFFTFHGTFTEFHLDFQSVAIVQMCQLQFAFGRVRWTLEWSQALPYSYILAVFIQGRFPLALHTLKVIQAKSHIDRNWKLTRQTCWKELVEVNLNMLILSCMVMAPNFGTAYIWISCFSTSIVNPDLYSFCIQTVIFQI